MYSPTKDEPKTSSEYIEYAKFWLSGDAGWREEDIEKFMIEFRGVVWKEYFDALEEAGTRFNVSTMFGTNG